jgi:hypothetical protein
MINSRQNNWLELKKMKVDIHNKKNQKTILIVGYISQ